MSEAANISKVHIEEEMKSAYIDYSMSVIVSRALPDVRDGLKPVHRRVLYGMYDLGLMGNRGYKKSARIVGEVLGKYHPHGDLSVYEAMVRMAQTWSMRYPLVDGQGNFGSVDGDRPAAMRYTEARLRRIAEETLSDMDKNTVDFKLNFDDTLKEPTVLPTRIPTLLVNGASGIAVGMATNIPPHNLSEIVDAIIAYLDNRNIEPEGLMNYVKGPDFPTGGIIYGTQGIKDAYETGKGRVVVRAKSEAETTPTGREKIIITEIPYQVNKAEMIRKTAELINEKKIEGISYINDESDRTGMRIVIILKKDAMAQVVLNNLYKHTQLQTSFNINNIALVNGRPRVLNLRQMIEHFVNHRHEIVVRRTEYELEQAENRAHILEGLFIALDNLDAVISLIRSSQTPEIAKNGLISEFGLTEIQAKAILDLRLHRLTGLEREKIREEYEELMKMIDYYRKILSSEEMRMQVIKDELLEVNEKYGDERRTEIVPDEGEFNPQDFYADDEVVITISNMGYLKRTLLTEYRTQSRGGVGSRGSITREEDFLEHLFVARMHNTMLFFTEKGKCHWLKVYQIPEGNKASKGRAVQNIIKIEPEDRIKAFINVKDFENEEFQKKHFIVFCTSKGVIKKTQLSAFSRPRQSGINAITLRENDYLIEARITGGDSEIMIASRSGRAIKFPEGALRPMGRMAAGVRGIMLRGKEDQAVGMICMRDENEDVLVVSEKGYGKRSKVQDYRRTNRGGKGVKTMNINEKTGELVAIKGVSDNNDLMLITKSGTAIRLSVEKIRTTGRTTQGVRLINLRNGETVAAVAIAEKNGDEIKEEETV